ncbi:MAG: hypothetical protein AB7O13_24800 [Alphaproteobacteria bacterium]
MRNPYKLVTLHSPGWAAFDAATLLISVGQPYHEGDKFAATVEWAARHFKRLHILVADTLQRHNETADWFARGSAWIERNRAAWVACQRQVTVSRWNDWIFKPEFPDILEQFRKAANGKLLHTAITQDVTNFAARQVAKGVSPRVEQSREYLLEELAAITLQARAVASARIYPGPELASFRAVAKGLVPDAPSGLERHYHTVIDFKRRPLPQEAKAPVTASKPARLRIA